MSAVDNRRKERLLKRLLHEIADADWTVMPVSISQRVQRLVREETGQADPYRALKDRMNQIALELLPALTDVFFLLTVKCPMIAAEIGAPVGSLVVRGGINGDAK